MDEDVFFSEQSRILRKLTNALIEATPEWWNRATLIVERHDGELGYTVRNTDHPRDVVVATDDVYAATFELDDLFEAHGQRWQRAILKIVKVGDDWQYDVDYTY